jgi:hemerythrin-like domain-containing protein
MCSYCGCEAESVIAALMADHAVIADLAYRIGRALDDERLEVAVGLTAELAEAFSRHSLLEEAGLFAQLRDAAGAEDEVDQLVADHERLRSALSAPDPTSDPSRLRRLLIELTRHAEMEDDDLFPFAMQQLPNDCWADLAPAPTA